MFQLQIFYIKITHPQQKLVNNSKAVTVLTEYTNAGSKSTHNHLHFSGV